MADRQSQRRVEGDEDGAGEENEIIKLANRIAKKDLRLIAKKSDECSSFDEARIVTAYKQAAVRSKGEARQALNGVDMEGLDPAEVEALGIALTELASAKGRPRDDDDE
jgi:hypothetical protein